MIDFKYDTSNNISFPAKKRRIMLLIDGEYYRMETERDIAFRYDNRGEYFQEAKIVYTLYKEDRKEFIGKATLYLVGQKAAALHVFAEYIGHKEIPDDFFELERIDVDENYKVKGIGTALLNYIMNDIVIFNELHETNIKVLLERVNNKINLPFYDKFGVKVNSRNQVDVEKDFSTPVIIDRPKPFSEVPRELADDYDYEKAGLKNPFTQPTKRK